MTTKWLNQGAPFPDPMHRYLQLVRMLGLDTLSWTPNFVHQRDELAMESHRLYFVLGLSPRRYGIAMHVELFHMTSRLRRHGNTLTQAAVGGEAGHIPHKNIANRKPKYTCHWCPDVVKASVEWSTRRLALWWAGHALPYRKCERITLPAVE